MKNFNNSIVRVRESLKIKKPAILSMNAVWCAYRCWDLLGVVDIKRNNFGDIGNVDKFWISWFECDLKKKKKRLKYKDISKKNVGFCSYGFIILRTS